MFVASHNMLKEVLLCVFVGFFFFCHFMKGEKLARNSVVEKQCPQDRRQLLLYFTKSLTQFYINFMYLSIVDAFINCSDESNLQFDTIVCAMGVRYKSYCSNIVRTLLVNPAEPVQKLYEFLVQVEEEVIAKLQHGVCGLYVVWMYTSVSVSVEFTL